MNAQQEAERLVDEFAYDWTHGEVPGWSHRDTLVRIVAAAIDYERAKPYCSCERPPEHSELVAAVGTIGRVRTGDEQP